MQIQRSLSHKRHLGGQSARSWTKGRFDNNRQRNAWLKQSGMNILTFRFTRSSLMGIADTNLLTIESILFVVLGVAGVGWIVFGLSQKPEIVGRNEAVRRMLEKQ